ncbi:MAG: glucose-1-phosphate adenylyltransferase [Lachnospiraceae bacterium]|nr:glucose-1-phosphate adenylyltransferase [Lachnospiraceae bacterium]
MRKKELVAMLLAGGQGSRLLALTKRNAKPAVAFGGKYRIIDFPLSNCTNSGIDTVGVLTQYKPLILNSYLGNGSAWDLDNPDGGLHILPPYYTETGGKWYEGTADAIYRNLDFLERYDPQYVVILSGDQLYKMDYSEMLAFHKEKNADLTVSVIEVPWEEASRFGIMTTDEDMKITKFSEKPKNPDSNLASMGIYIFTYSVLKKVLTKDHADPNSGKDFGGDVIPMMLKNGHPLYAYTFSGYWKDVGTIDSYYNTQMELMADDPEFDLFDSKLKIYSNSNLSAPQYIGRRGLVRSSFVCNGCVILGSVNHSILSSDVYVGDGATVEDSIILPGARIEANAHVRRAILGEESIVLENTILDGMQLDDAPNHIAVIGDSAVYPKKGGASE